MFVAGNVVKSKINSKLATVTERLADGMIRVRFDGDTGTVDLHESRFNAYYTAHVEHAFKSVDPETFKKGDYIQVTDGNGVTVKGAAMNDLETFGYASFDLLTEDGQLLDFNNNYVNVTVLFRADIARGVMPKY